jgi:hypothetical protein
MTAPDSLAPVEEVICTARDENGTICSSAEHADAGDVTCEQWRTTGCHDTPSEADAMTAGVGCEHRFCDADGNRVYLYCQSGCGARDPLEPDLPGSDRRRCPKCGSVYPPEFVVENTCPNCRTEMGGPAAPLAIGSTWTEPDAEARRAARNQVVLETGERQFIDGDREEWCSACSKHIRRHYGGVEYRCDPRNDPPPASEIDTLRGRVGELEAEVDAERENNANAAAVVHGQAEQLEALRLSLGETQSQLASAHLACEASRRDRHFLNLRLESAERANEASRKARDEAVTERDRLVQSIPPGIIKAYGAVSDEVARIVRDYIVRTTGPEPALEGLGRIEEKLVEGGKAIAREKARKRKPAKPKPTRLPGKRRKAGR